MILYRFTYFIIIFLMCKIDDMISHNDVYYVLRSEKKYG